MPGAEPPGGPAPDTIAAIATPAGRGAIGIVRASGPLAPTIARRVLGRLPEPRVATRCAARNAAGEALDEGLALYFPAPHSFTAEDVLEFQGHGGMVVLRVVLAAFLDAGARLAEPGEFTRRAFLNGRMDLAQAEAVADLIDASSAQAARSALRSLSGEFSDAIRAVVAQLVDLRALTEATLDFPEEEVDVLHRDEVAARLAQLRASLDGVVSRSKEGNLLRDGVHVVLAGRPNVGKSSLLNRLAGEDRAIVTAIPGTTRDTLREAISIDGVPLTLVDTAGLRATADEIERQGVERTHREVGQADLLIAVFDAASQDWSLPVTPAAAAARIDVYNKVDLVPGFVLPSTGHRAVAVSAKTGAGIDALRQAILEAAGWKSHGESVFLARERHLRALREASDRLDAAAQQVRQWELFAEELRLAQRALDTITGEVTADDLLGEIFSRFCIGK